MAAGERGTQRQNREDGKRPLPISPAAFQVDELRQFGVANIRHLPRLTLEERHTRRHTNGELNDEW